MESLKFKGNKVTGTIPNELYMAIIRIQGDKNLSFEEACIEAAILIDPKREEFDKKVEKKAETLSKSRFLTQLNIAKQTIKNTAYKEGFKKGKMVYRLPCYVCGKDMSLNSQIWESAKEFLNNKWRHSECN